MESVGNGLTGLANVGNTCYLNSVLQVLSHTIPLTDLLEDESLSRKMKKNNGAMLIEEWNKLRELMWSEDCTIAPWGFVKAVQSVCRSDGNREFSSFGQCDVSEFWQFLIDKFHKGLSRSVVMSVKGKPKNSRDILASKCYEMMKTMYEKEYSEIVSIFIGISVSRICDTDGRPISVSPEPFSSIQLPIIFRKNVNEIDMLDCLAEYCKKERLDGENAYYDEKQDRKISADRDFVFWSLPSILIIHLKRFSNSLSKLHQRIRFPVEELDMTPFVVGYRRNDFKYELYGVCNHGGSVHGGHYHADVKTEKGWYNFNDTELKKCSNISGVSASAYTLFYRKK